MVLCCSVLLGACNNKEKKFDSKEKIDKQESKSDIIVEEESMIELVNRSEVYFDNAIELIDVKSYEDASGNLILAIDALEDEAIYFDEEQEKSLDDLISKMSSINSKLESAENIDEPALMKEIAEAEVLVGHKYLLVSKSYLIEAPETAKEFLKKSITKLEQGTTRMEGQAKIAGKEIVKDTKLLLQKMESDGQLVADDFEKHLTVLQKYFIDHGFNVY